MCIDFGTVQIAHFEMEGQMLLKAGWRSAIKANGVQCVMMPLEQQMLVWPVTSLGFLEQVRTYMLNFYTW